ncbi:MAG: hypothetical protein HZT41_07360 [Dechloromonas sp.]|nr:MAG: hypothetical protein HZT41_07360 [Dechloromonas sp.]
MDPQNLAYALIQLVHNFGAVAVVGGAVAARWLARDAPATQRRLAWLVLAGWLAQAASGAGFGAVSFLFYGRFPDIHAIARVALLLKMACAASGILLAAGYLKRAADWLPARRDTVWTLLLVIAVTALASAAFLRWFA